MLRGHSYDLLLAIVSFYHLFNDDFFFPLKMLSLSVYFRRDFGFENFLRTT
jgi:hypothetical protein